MAPPGWIARSVFPSLLLAKLAVKTGVYIKNMSKFRSFHRSPHISAFFFPAGSTSQAETKERDILGNPLTKEAYHKDPRSLAPFSSMHDYCPAPISIAVMRSFNSPCSPPIHPSTETSSRASVDFYDNSISRPSRIN